MTLHHAFLLTALLLAALPPSQAAPGKTVEPARTMTRSSQYDFINLGSQLDQRPPVSSTVWGFVDKVSSLNDNLIGIDTDRAMAQQTRNHESATHASDYGNTSSAGQGDSYACIVYCASGSTTVMVQASSRSDAARIADGQSDAICRGDNRGNSTSRRLPPEQCSKR